MRTPSHKLLTRLAALAAGTLLLAAGCSDDDSGQNSNTNEDAGLVCDTDASVTFAEPMTVTDYEALLIVPDSLKADFQPLATFHTQTGTPTRIVTVEEICDATTCADNDPKIDTAKAIKDYIMAQPGLQHVVLGGDLEHVPSRLTDDRYESSFGDAYDEVFYSDYYFAEFSNWDTDGDGQYAEWDDDTPDYRPEISVSRIPASTADDVRSYTEKVIRYSTAYRPEHVQRALLVANIATRIGGAGINSGQYFEASGRTLDRLPESFAVSKLYHPENSPDPAAQDASATNQIAAFATGYNLMIHNGHAYPSLLTTEQVADAPYDFEAGQAYRLQNTTYPIYLSCGCQAGQFEAPFVWGGQTFPEDAAGEQLVNAPDGGAVAYLGNTTTGLGLAGGSQFIDEMLSEMVDHPGLLLGDAMYAAHHRLPETDSFPFPIGGDVQVMDADSYRWTQKAVVLLGDGLIPVWITPRAEAPTLTVTKTEVCHGVRLEVTVSDPAVTMVYVSDGADIYELPLTAGSGTLHVAGPGTGLTVAAPSSTTFYLFHAVE